MLSQDRISVEVHVVGVRRVMRLGGRGAVHYICPRVGGRCLCGGVFWQTEQSLQRLEARSTEIPEVEDAGVIWGWWDGQVEDPVKCGMDHVTFQEGGLDPWFLL